MSAVPETSEAQMVTLSVNGQELRGRAGQTILEVAQTAGIDIPTLCHDPRLEPYGACRMCLVEVEGARGPMAACGTAIREGMKVQTHSEKIVKMRRFVLELLLTNHPLDCPVCEAAGDCRLQDYAYEYLVDMVPWGWRPPAAVDPGDHPHIAHFGSRCILCGRCVRICREVMGIGCWGYLNRGYDSEVDTPYRLPLAAVDCVSCGQCVSTCPVGAIVGRRAGQGARQWQTTKTATTCSYCADGCALVLHDYKGKVVKVGSDPEIGINQGNLCVKGRFGIGYTHSPDRVTAPLVRNAKGELEETSWDGALGLITEKIGEVLRAKGGEAIGAVCGTHCTNEAAYLLQKFMRTVIGSNNIDTVDSPEREASDEALSGTLGVAGATNSRVDMDRADVILVVGANLTESHPVLALSVIRALRLGKTVIVIDPRRTELAAKATMHLAVRAGTDLAALRAMMRHILDVKLSDTDFIKSRTEGTAALEGMLMSLDLGVEAGTCAVDVDLIRAAAVAYGQAASALILYGTGVTQGPMAVKTVAALADLALLTGNMGRPGAGLIPLRSGANSQGIADMGVGPARLPGGTSLDDAEEMGKVESAWGTPLSGLARGASLAEMLTPTKSGGLSLLYVMGADPALAVPDERAVRSALEQVDFVVLQDSFLSDTAEYADVVLPAAVAAEDDGTFTNGERFVQRVRAAVAAEGQCRQDWRIVQAVANSVGAAWSYDSPAKVMGEIAEVAPTYRGIAYERLEAERIQWPCVDANAPGAAILHMDGFRGGKANIVTVEGAVSGAVTDTKFPLALVTGTAREHHGTGVRTRRAPGLTTLVGEACLEMNAGDAKAAKVDDGDKARVVSQRGGEIQVVVRVNSRTPAGTVFLPGFSATAPVTRLLGREGSASPAVRVERLT